MCVVLLIESSHFQYVVLKSTCSLFSKWCAVVDCFSLFPYGILRKTMNEEKQIIVAKSIYIALERKCADFCSFDYASPTFNISSAFRFRCILGFSCFLMTDMVFFLLLAIS